MDFSTLKIELFNAVAMIELHRPERANAIDMTMFFEIRDAMRWLDESPTVRVGIIRGAGKHFTAGIDLSLLGEFQKQVLDDCEGRSREKLRRLILDPLQTAFNEIERCRKPVIAAIHGACVGAGIDLISACDIRYCSSDAYFSVKEIDVGMTADLGTLQRLPHLVGPGIARELAYTGRPVDGEEAQRVRLVNRCFETRALLDAHVVETARIIAAKSPLSIRGCKEMITYARDHSVADGLNYIATWNAAMFLSDDLEEAAKARTEKCTAVFND